MDARPKLKFNSADFLANDLTLGLIARCAMMNSKDNMPKIKIYSTVTCAYCRAEKAWLDQKGLKYEVVMVDSDPAAAQEMIAQSGQMAVPFTVITKDDGSVAKILGFDQPALSAALGV